MEARVNYTLVGLFVVILGGTIVAAVAWLLSAGEIKIFHTYRVYVTESVAGLNVNAAVRYKGVDVGKVSEIKLDPDNPERVELLLQIERDTPIREQTVARLVSQGITGLVNVELDGDASSPPLMPSAEDPIPEIRSGPSLVTQLEDAFKTLSRTMNALLSAENVGSLARTLYNIEHVTDNLSSNSAAIERNLANLEAFTSTLAANAKKIDTAIENAAIAFGRGAQIGGQITPLITQFDASATALQTMAVSITRTSEDLNKAIDRTRKDLTKEIQQINRDTSPQLNRLLLELSDLATSMQRIVQELERNPRGLLFGGSTRRPGPGE